MVMVSQGKGAIKNTLSAVSRTPHIQMDKAIGKSGIHGTEVKLKITKAPTRS